MLKLEIDEIRHNYETNSVLEKENFKSGTTYSKLKQKQVTHLIIIYLALPARVCLADSKTPAY
jgi:hypothetical protein